MNPGTLRRIALVGLAALMLVSAGYVLVPIVGMSPGYVFAFFKLLALGFVFKRVNDGDVYTMQWSSMFILLFLAEGTVRATSDPQPSAAMGAVEAVLATIYFLAVLSVLRPMKKAAKQARPLPKEPE